MAASSRSDSASAALAWEAGMGGSGPPRPLDAAVMVSGNRSRTTMSFMWGRCEVATARSVGSVGDSAMHDGEKAIQAFA